MGVKIFAPGNMAGDHGFSLAPVLFYKKRKVEMADEAGHKDGGKKTMEEAAVKNEIPAQAEKGEGEEVAERLPDYRSGQDEGQEVSGHRPVEKDLPGVVLGSKGVELGKPKEVFKDGRNFLRLLPVDGHWIGGPGDKTFVDDMKN